jgi:hypothetical protein
MHKYGVQPLELKRSRTPRVVSLSTQLTFKLIFRELNAAYDFRLLRYADITSSLDTRSAPQRRSDS